MNNLKSACTDLYKAVIAIILDVHDNLLKREESLINNIDTVQDLLKIKFRTEGINDTIKAILKRLGEESDGLSKIAISNEKEE